MFIKCRAIWPSSCLCSGQNRSDHRSSRQEVFCKKGVLRNFTKFTGKHLCQSLFFNKVAGLASVDSISCESVSCEKLWCDILSNRNRVSYQAKDYEWSALRKKCPYSKLLWSVLSRIWTEYGGIRNISPYSVRMPQNTGQNNCEHRYFLRSGASEQK